MRKAAKVLVFIIYTVVVLIVGGYVGIIFNRGYKGYEVAKANVDYKYNATQAAKDVTGSAVSHRALSNTAAASWHKFQACQAKGEIDCPAPKK
jgi:hypothetical protein